MNKKKKRKQFPFMYHSNEATGDNRQSQPTAARDNFLNDSTFPFPFSHNILQRERMTATDTHTHSHTQMTHSYICMYTIKESTRIYYPSYVHMYVYSCGCMYVCIYLQHIHIQTVIMFMTHKSFKSFTRQCIAGYVLCISVCM